MGTLEMTEFDVCLVVESSSLTLADLTGRLGIASSDGSHDMGEPHLIKSRGVWRSSVWQLSSEVGREATLDDHVTALAARIPYERIKTVLPPDARVYLSIGVFSDAQIPTVSLTPRGVAVAMSIGAGVEVRYYSPDMES
jgi:hypothetical protein